jgi:uncharacterized caspase-like protein
MFLATTILFSLAGEVQAAEFQAQEAQVQTYAEKLRTGKRYALVIGISEYQDEGIIDLTTAAHDAEEVGAMLEVYYGFEVTNLIDEQATKRAIAREMNRLFQKVNEQDSVLIYFAGHGQRDEQRAYWMPYDAEASGADLGEDDTWVSHSDLRDRLARLAKAKHILVLSDSCWAGALFGGKMRGASRQPTPPENRDFEPWIRKVSEKKSRVIFTSGGDEPVADETREVSAEHSIFAHYFLQALQQELASAPFTTDMLVGFMKPAIGNQEDQQPDSAPIPRLPHEGGEMVFVSEAVRRKAAEPNAKQANFYSAIDNSLFAQTQAQKTQFRQWLGVKNEKVKTLVQGKDATALESQYLATLDAWAERLEIPVIINSSLMEVSSISAEIAIAFTFKDTPVEIVAESNALNQENAALFLDYQIQTIDIQKRLLLLKEKYFLYWQDWHLDYISLMLAQNAIRFVDATYSMPNSFSHVEDDDSKMEMEEMFQDQLLEIASPWEDIAVGRLRKLLAAPQWYKDHYEACALLQKKRPSEVRTGQCDTPRQQGPDIHITTALAHLRKSGAAPSAQDLPFLLALANNAVHNHWSEGMIGLLEMAVSLAPGDPVVLNLLGLAHFYSESPEGKENARKILAHAATKHPYRPEIQKSLFWLAENPAQEVAALTQMIALQGHESAAGWQCHDIYLNLGDMTACKTTLKRLKNAQRAVRAEERRAELENARKQKAESLSGVTSITSVVKRFKGRIKLCHDQALGRNPDTKGRIEIEFSVAGGTVQTALIAKNDTGDADLEACILRKIKGLTFDPSVEAEVTYPFMLTPQ